MKIYTKTGDKGDTSTYFSQKISKSNLRFEVYGSVDELNSWLGLILRLIKEEDLKNIFIQIQNDLFDLIADIETFINIGNKRGKKNISRITKEHIRQLEQWIDFYQDKLPPLQQFILPGGALVSCYLHLSRSVCRRTERCIVRLQKSKPINLSILIYLNRLSDLLFVLARWFNFQQNIQELFWKSK